MKLIPALLALALLAACGADGEPIAPTRAKAAPSSGISVSGEARFGVVKTF